MTENPSAFPLNATNDATPGAFCPDPGMTLRDYFAAQAPVTLFDAAMSCGWDSLAAANMGQDSYRATLWAVMTLMRYEYADAMLSARQETRHG